jgi:hypothetical protein
MSRARHLQGPGHGFVAIQPTIVPTPVNRMTAAPRRDPVAASRLGA